MHFSAISVLCFLQVKVVDKTDGLPEHDVDLDALHKDFPTFQNLNDDENC